MNGGSDQHLVLPLTYEQVVFGVMWGLSGSKVIARLISRQASVQRKHIEWTMMVNAVLGRKNIRACDWCFKPCNIAKQTHYHLRHRRYRKGRRQRERFGGTWLCAIKGPHRVVDRWPETICNPCMRTHTQKSMFAFAHPLYQQLPEGFMAGLVYE